MWMTPRRLVHLFPRIWRARYGAEFEALLESSPLTRRTVADVVRRAAGEWIAHTLIGRVILGTVLALAATALADLLTLITPGGLGNQSWLIVTPFVFGLVEVGMGCRFLWCALMRERILRREQTAWMTALFVMSVAVLWAARVVFTDPGLSLWRATSVGTWAMLVQSSMQAMAMSRILPRRLPGTNPG